MIILDLCFLLYKHTEKGLGLWSHRRDIIKTYMYENNLDVMMIMVYSFFDFFYKYLRAYYWLDNIPINEGQ